MLTRDELNLCREWFNHLQDCTTNYLETRDYALAKKIYELLGARVPHSILRGLGITPARGELSQYDKDFEAAVAKCAKELADSIDRDVMSGVIKDNKR